MLLYVLSFSAFLLAVGGLSIGVLAGRGGIRGTCGGLNNPDGCGSCGRSADSSNDRCPKRPVR